MEMTGSLFVMPQGALKGRRWPARMNSSQHQGGASALAKRAAKKHRKLAKMALTLS